MSGFVCLPDAGALVCTLSRVLFLAPFVQRLVRRAKPTLKRRVADTVKRRVTLLYLCNHFPLAVPPWTAIQEVQETSDEQEQSGRIGGMFCVFGQGDMAL